MNHLQITWAVDGGSVYCLYVFLVPHFLSLISLFKSREKGSHGKRPRMIDSCPFDGHRRRILALI